MLKINSIGILYLLNILIYYKSNILMKIEFNYKSTL